MSAGSVKDLQGTSLTAYNGTFTLDYTAPRVISSSIADGAILPTGDLTFTVTFSEPLQASLVDPSDIGLFGSYFNTFQNPDSIAFNAAGTAMTVNFSGLGDDAYRLVLFANESSFVDRVGLVLDGEPPVVSGNGIEGGDFYLNFVTDLGTQALPVPLVPIEPLGSLVYQTPSDTSAVIAFTGDTDDFTISLDANQTATVLVNGVSPAITPQVTLTGPGGTIATAVASVPGGTAIIQSALTNGAGTYTVSVGSVADLGLYSVRLIVNAAVEEENYGGPTDDDLGTAQSLDSAFVDLGNGMSRAAVLGTADVSNALANGSFETGDFLGWTTLTTGSPFVDWTVSQAGPGSGFFAGTSPQDGLYDAWNGFDGSGPMTFTMYQDIVIPGGATNPTFSWQDRVQWNFLLTSSATQPRLYHVQIVDPATSTILETVYSFSTGTAYIVGDTTWQTHAANLTAYVGQTIRLQFQKFIPEAYTGPGQIEFDNIRIDGLPTRDDYYAVNLIAGQATNVSARRPYRHRYSSGIDRPVEQRCGPPPLRTTPTQ